VFNIAFNEDKPVVSFIVNSNELN